MVSFYTVVVLSIAVVAISTSKHRGISCNVGTELSHHVDSGFTECQSTLNLQTGAVRLSGHRGGKSFPVDGYYDRVRECKIELNHANEMVVKCRCNESECNQPLSNSEIVEYFKTI